MLHRNMSKDEALEESARLLDQVGMSDPEERVYEYPFQLSGGLRQRAMIAMAMACNPAIMIADEPTTALDVTIQAQILRLMRRLKAEHDTAIIFITHDLAVIASFADRVMVMYAGVAVEEAPVQKIFKNPSHPYTRGLLASIPAVAAEESEPGSRKLLATIPGTLPDPRNFPPGCRFAPRCKEVMEKCSKAEPGFTWLDNDHKVRCYLYGDTVAGEEEE
jgi:oligopeptide/dipeptide ABC transporter ATP-binding protein